jgi:hypothetical protein
MRRLSLTALLVLMLLVPRIASAAPIFELPSVTVFPGTTTSFVVSVVTDNTSYSVAAYTTRVELASNGGTGITLTGATDDTGAANYIFAGDSVFGGSDGNTSTDQGRATSVTSVSSVTLNANTTYAMMTVSIAASPTATGTYTLSFFPSDNDNDLGGPTGNDILVNHAGTAIVQTPEPGTLLLLAPVLGLLVARRRRAV